MVSYDKGRFRRMSPDSLFVFLTEVIKLTRRIPTSRVRWISGRARAACWGTQYRLRGYGR